MGEGYSRALFGSLAEAAAVTLCWDSGDIHRSGESLEFIAPASVAVIILHRRRRRREGTHIVDVIRIEHMDGLHARKAHRARQIVGGKRSWNVDTPGDDITTWEINIAFSFFFVLYILP